MKTLLLLLTTFGPRFAFAQNPVVLPLCTAFQNSNCTIPGTAITGTLGVANGGTGAASFNQNALIQGNGTGALSAATTGEILQNGAPTNGGMYPNAPLLLRGNINSYLQQVIQNLSNGANASTEYTGNNDLGGNTSYYFTLGMNSSKYSQAAFALEPASATFLHGSDGPVYIWSDTNGGLNGAATGYVIIGSSNESAGNLAAMFTPSSTTIFGQTLHILPVTFSSNVVSNSSITTNGGFFGNGAGITNLPEASIATMTAFTDKANGFTYPQTFVASATVQNNLLINNNGNFTLFNSTKNGVMYGGGTSAMGMTAELGNGGLVIGGVGSSPSTGTLTSTMAGIAVTLGAGTIKLSTGSTLVDSAVDANWAHSQTSPSGSTWTFNGGIRTTAAVELASNTATMNGNATYGLALLGEGIHLSSAPLRIDGNQTNSLLIGPQTAAMAASTVAIGGSVSIQGQLITYSSASLTGTSTNDSASPGFVGEYISTTPTSAISLGLTGAYVSVATTTLTAGDWDCQGTLGLTDGATTAGTQIVACVSKTINACDLGGTGTEGFAEMSYALIANDGQYTPTSLRRITVTGNPIGLFLTGNVTYTVLGGASYAINSVLRCRRVR